MGGSCWWASFWQMAGSYSIHNGTQYRRTPLELAVYSCHRIGVLLPEVSEYRDQGFTRCTGHLFLYRCLCALWRRSRHHHGWRLVWVVVCKHLRLFLQYRSNHLYLPACRNGCMEHLWDVCWPELHSSEHIILIECCIIRYSFLWIRLVFRGYRCCCPHYPVVCS